VRAIILAGGYAKRLWPLTLETPKPLLPVGDGCILDYILAKMDGLGIEETIVSTNKKFEEKFNEWIRACDLSNIRVVPEPSAKEEEKLGPVKALSLILADSAPDDYIVAAGDNLFSLDLLKMLSFYRSVRSPVVALYELGDRGLARQYACIEIDGSGRIMSFEEKPLEPKSTLISTGIYLMPWRSISRVDEYLGEGNPPDPVGRFIGWLVKREDVYGFKFKGYWYDIGSMESYKAAQVHFRDTPCRP